MQQFTEEQQKQLQEKIRSMSPEQLKELQKQQCIFCQIIAGKLSSHNVYEDTLCMAVLDINPAAKGHLLLFPKNHYAIMPQVPEDIQGHLLVTAKKLSKLLLKTFRADGTNIFVANGQAAGQRAQHFLIHIIPRKGGDGILPLEEKLVDQEMVLKVKNVVGEKLQELLGFKKKAKAAVPEKHPGESGEEKEAAENETIETEAKEEIKSAAGPKTGLKTKPKNKEKETKSKLKPVPAKKTVKKEGEVSLDDIAKLFR